MRDPFHQYPFEEEDLARYNAAFLRNTGQFTDGDGTHGWATVTKITPLGDSGRALVALKWPNGIERRVLDANLQKQGARLRVCDGAD